MTANLKGDSDSMCPSDFRIATHKRCLILFLLISTFLFSACDPRAGRYPFHKAEYWISEDPQISLCYTKNTDGTWYPDHTLIWENEEKEISIGMQADYYCVYPADSNHHDDRLFSGNWRYRGKDLVLTIEEDFIFDGTYSKIILRPQEELATP